MLTCGKVVRATTSLASLNTPAPPKRSVLLRQRLISDSRGSESNRKSTPLVDTLAFNPLDSLGPSNDHNVASPGDRPRMLTIQQQQRCHTGSNQSMSSSQPFTRATIMPLLLQAPVSDGVLKLEMSSCMVVLLMPLSTTFLWVIQLTLPCLNTEILNLKTTRLLQEDIDRAWLSR